MSTRKSLETTLPIGSEVQSGGKRTWFRIEKYNQHGVRIASTSSSKTALIRFEKFDLVLERFHQIDPSRIQDSIMELMKEYSLHWNVNETFLYGLVREYRNRTANPDLDELQERFEYRVNEYARMSEAERRLHLDRSPKKPEKVVVRTTIFMRNPAVVAEVRLRAAGICESCGRRAPFLRRKDESPYLEVHHRQPLADNGDDTVENAVALCPNCHRREHYA